MIIKPILTIIETLEKIMGRGYPGRRKREIMNKRKLKTACPLLMIDNEFDKILDFISPEPEK